MRYYTLEGVVRALCRASFAERALRIMSWMDVRQGLTLVHFSAQPEPFLTPNKPLIPPDTPLHPLGTR